MSIPLEEMSARKAKIQEAMAKGGLDGLLVYANQLKPMSLHFVANYTLLGSQAICWLPLTGQPVLLISEAWDTDSAVKESGLADVRVLGEDWPKAIADLCRSSKGRLGLADREMMGQQALHSLERAIGREVPSATRFLEDLATIKSPYELEMIRAAARMADAGFERALAVMREGLRDYELVAEIDYTMRQMGATDNFQMLAVGKHSTGMLLPMGKKVERGDLILFEITPANGSETYSAQLCRTAIFGEPPSEVTLNKYDILIKALEDSLAIIKPGVRISEVAKMQNEIIEKAGYPEYCQPPFMRARGHGFGLGRIELDEESELEFAPGITLVVHPNQYLPETGYLALGEHIIVTETGIDRLTTTESKIYVCS